MMAKNLMRIRTAIFFITAILLGLPTGAWAVNLPLSKELTVRLSTLNSHGQLITASEIVAKTDSLGKIAFNFPSVPSSAITPFLNIQIMDGATVLRQTIIPSPQPGGTIDAGVSEVTDLQARAVLKASAISGRLTPLHLLVAHALLRTPTISSANAESVGTAVAAGADAIANVLATDGLTSDQLTTLMNSLSKGLADTATMYRKSVDDAVSFDQKVEAYRRGEAFAVLLQSLIRAGSDAGINLETICTAFASAGEATESVIASIQGVDPISKAGMRYGFVTGILNLSNYRMLRQLLNSFSYVGITPPKFAHLFNVFDLVLLNTTNIQKGEDGGLLSSSMQNDIQLFSQLEFNSLATQDLLLFKMGMESFSVTANPESANLMLDITSRMANMGGIMSGMTPVILMGIFGRLISPPPLFKATEAVLAASFVPTLTPYELAAWSYIYQQPSFTYIPIIGLIDQLVIKPTTIPSFDKLAEPYKSLALLMYDQSLIGSLRWQDQQEAEAYIIANPSNPPRWYPLANVHQILEKDRQRLAVVRQHMSGVSPDTKDALIYLLNRNRMTEF